MGNVYIVTHKKINFPENITYKIIQSGSAINEKLGYLRDDIGDNISSKNLMYNELDCIYWVYKNVDSDYFGFCHYRRFFGGKELYRCNEKNFFIIDNDEIVHILNEYDCILPKKKIIIHNVYKHYVFARKNMVEIHQNDINCLKKVILQKYPDYFDSLEFVLSSHKCRYCNMFIMKKEIFKKYCDFIFDVLFEFEKLIPYRTRVCGAMGELLLNVFINKNSNYKIFDKKIVQIEKTTLLQKIKRKYFSK